ncbi:helix-turn-helix transcriptional regulator [Catenuloplanes atrovinosus]|uniref:Transcriptional regulator with XRE-family HTH domain n=1 Tax=Catenuloplanes atrovinosus TaxID=137266 RepID=A0AAE4CE00_9ACTN|nr:helix-turn-helix transcriptional regulator [Catenuloplanes atrovinosus]MDR7279569.1 transcriptional regulator with XRE-family HTH domain [Catenuloplanes atrovinosus]
MGRPEKTITTGVRELAALAEHLRRLRAASGRTYPELERAGGYSASVFSRAASGDALPTWQVARAYGTACGADEQALRLVWERARDALTRQRSSAATDDPAGAPTAPTDFNLRLRELIRRRSTQRAVAARANYSPSTVSAALNATRVPSGEFLDRILTSLDLPDDDRERWREWRATLAAPDPEPAVPDLPAAAPRIPGARAPHPTPGPPPLAALAPIVLAALLLAALFTLLSAVIDWWASGC